MFRVFSVQQKEQNFFTVHQNFQKTIHSGTVKLKKKNVNKEDGFYEQTTLRRDRSSFIKQYTSMWNFYFLIFGDKCL